jgi:hypothetical protein
MLQDLTAQMYWAYLQNDELALSNKETVQDRREWFLLLMQTIDRGDDRE